MYAVIFRASIKQLDETYSQTANRLRELAMKKYGCLEFTSVTEGNQEIAISYWSELEQIQNWKQDAQHRAAQQRGRKKWYDSYQVQIVELLRDYDFQL